MLLNDIYIHIRYEYIIMRFSSGAKKQLISHNAESRNENEEKKRNLKRYNICLFLFITFFIKKIDGCHFFTRV